MDNVIAKPRERIVWIDVAKFLGFVLVIVGHLIVIYDWTDSMARGMIFSFHMPLFFMLSFITTSLSDSLSTFWKRTKKRAYHLLIPFVITVFIQTVLVIFYDKQDASTWEFWRNFVFYKLLGIEGTGYISVGTCWFFFAIFVAQSLFDIVHLALKKDSLLFVVSIIFTVIGFAIGYLKFIPPFYMDMVLSSFIFFFIGYKLRSIDLSKYQIERFVIALLIWAATFFLIYDKNVYNSYYEIWTRNYPLFPLCHICAIAGSITFIYLCIFISKIKSIGKVLGYLGQFNTIYIIVHTIHQHYFIKWFNYYPEQVFLNNIVQLSIGIGITIGVIILWKLLLFSKKKILIKQVKY